MTLAKEKIKRKLKKSTKVSPEENLYKIRLRLLCYSNGKLPSHEVFTKGDIPNNWIEIVNYLDNSQNWLKKRKLIHIEMINKYFPHCLFLSKKLEESINNQTRLVNKKKPFFVLGKNINFSGYPFLIFLRGNSASGKTTLISQQLGLKKNNIGTKCISGVIDPDFFKSQLMLKTLKEIRNFPLLRHGKKGKIFHHQFDLESFILVRTLAKKLFKQKASMIFDRRFDYYEDILELMDWGIENKYAYSFLIDIDVPLELSLIRILSRDIYGYSPLVPLNSILNGFKRIRVNRYKTILKLQQHRLKSYYKLYILDVKRGEFIPTVYAANGNIVENQKYKKQINIAFARSLVPERIIKETPKKVISKNYLHTLLSASLINEKQLKAAEKYIGLTFKKAFQIKFRNASF